LLTHVNPPPNQLRFIFVCKGLTRVIPFRKYLTPFNTNIAKSQSRCTWTAVCICMFSCAEGLVVGTNSF